MLALLFWLLVAVVVYVYAGYPLAVRLLAGRSGNPTDRRADHAPTLSLIITAYNEERSIHGKLLNSLALDYPREKLEILVVSDGSTDRTVEITKGFADKGVRLVALPSNRGKSAAQNAAAAEARGEIILFSDADVDLAPDTLKAMMKHFSDPGVGCVTGKIRYREGEDTGVARGEDLYWRYETWLRTRESALGNLAMGSGLLAIRRRLFAPLDPDVGDDFVLPMRTAMSGHRVAFATDAVGETVLFQSHSGDMLRTRIRIITKDLKGLFSCRAIMNPLSHPMHAWGLISHKLLRWLVPYFLIILFGLSLALMDGPFFRYAVLVQSAFYALALANLMLGERAAFSRLLCVPFSFCLVNYAALIGVARFAMGKRSGRWQPVR